MDEDDGSRDTAIPPGEAVKRAMERLGWSQSDLAFALGVTTATINQIVAGKRGVSHAMAKALGVALEIDPRILVTMQAEWELQQTDGPPEIVRVRSRILADYPLREMIKRGWVPETDDPSKLREKICRFFDVQDIGDIPHLPYAARSGRNSAPPSQRAWVSRVKQIAHEVQAPAFNAAKLEQALERLSDARSEPQGVRHVPRLLQDAGIRFIVVEDLPQSNMDGVCLWLHDKAPVIGMSLRFDRIDNFWFVLRHECAHVLHGHGKSAPKLDADLTQTIGREVDEEERIANAEASDFCVAQDKMTSFYLRKNPLFSERDVLAFSKKMSVHPGLVVGQLHWRTDRYDFLRRHLAKVREHLAMTTMMDGWGDVIPVGQ